MGALLDSLLQGLDAPAAQAIRDAGLPDRRSEAWKYTSLRALDRRTFAPARPVRPEPALLAGLMVPAVVFTNGLIDDASPWAHADLPEGLHLVLGRESADVDVSAAMAGTSESVFERINALAATAGMRLTASGHIDTPIQLVQINVKDGDDRAVHLHHRIHLQAGASLTLIEYALGDAVHANLDNTRIDVVLESGARLVHVRVQDDNAAASRFLRTHAVLDSNAQYRRLDLELGAALSRHALDVRLSGDSASVDAGGVLLADARRHLDTRLDIVHAAPNTRATLPWRGLAADRARAVFHGGIRIEAGADGSQADLQNRNLLLSALAEIDTQPTLVIHADEVKAAHGATVGQLDAIALFYLRSRGLPEAEARRLLTAAFVRDLLIGIEDAALRAWLDSRLQSALARLHGP